LIPHKESFIGTMESALASGGIFRDTEEKCIEVVKKFDNVKCRNFNEWMSIGKSQQRQQPFPSILIKQNENEARSNLLKSLLSKFTYANEDPCDDVKTHEDLLNEIWNNYRFSHKMYFSTEEYKESLSDLQKQIGSCNIF